MPVIAAATELSKSDVLIALITAEGLIFAALSVTSSLAAGSRFGAKTLGPAWLLSAVATALLALIATATVLAWVDLFAGTHWPPSTDRQLEALGLLLAIVAQPLVAGFISVGLIRG